MTETTRTFYRIRFPAKAGSYGEWHRSNNGTSEWPTLAKIKAILTQGIRGGYKGRIRAEFTDYEIVEVTEHVRTETRVVAL